MCDLLRLSDRESENVLLPTTSSVTAVGLNFCHYSEQVQLCVHNTYNKYVTYVNMH